MEEHFYVATGLRLNGLSNFMGWIKQGSYYHGLVARQGQLHKCPHLVGVALPRWPQVTPSESHQVSQKKVETPATSSSAPSTGASKAQETHSNDVPAPMEKGRAGDGQSWVDQVEASADDEFQRDRPVKHRQSQSRRQEDQPTLPFLFQDNEGRCASAQQLYQHAGEQPWARCNVAALGITHLHLEVEPHEARSVGNQVLCMIAEYHLTSSAQGTSSLCPILLEVVRDLLPPIEDYIAGGTFQGMRDVRVAERFPDQMKLAEVIPLYKNKAMDHLVNYRPISLLITISKILEKIVYNRVVKFINKNDVLFKSQYGFRSKHSCEQAVQELLAKILHSQEDGHKTASIFMDLSKAFDTLNHDLLLKKMERYGIRGVSLKWFKSYLAGHSLIAKVPTSENKSTYSNTFNISCGTAQGSCLGPLLFILFCNDIYLQELYGSLILFADDTTLYNSHHSLNYLNFIMSHDLSVLGDWFRANQLSLNPSKSVVMYFNSKKTSPDVMLDGIVIPRVNTHKFLGTWIDNDLAWNTQVQFVVSKLRSNCQLLSLAKNILPAEVLRTVYFSHIHSHLNYNLSVCGSMLSKSQVSDISQLQQKCIQLMIKKNSTSVDAIFRKLKLLKLSDMIKIELCKFGARISNNLLPKPIQELMKKRSGWKTHGYDTRNKRIPNTQKHTTTRFNISFMRRGITEYSNLTFDLKSITNITTLTTKLKNIMVTSY